MQPLSLLFLVITPLFVQSGDLIKVIGVNCPPGEFCITNLVDETTQEQALQTDPMATGFAIFGNARNLILEIHKLDLWLVGYVASMFHVSIPPVFFMLISVSLLFVALYMIAKFAVKTTKHSVIIAIVAVAAIMLVPFGIGAVQS